MVVEKPRKLTIMNLAKYVYDEQRDYDTPPAEMEDITELLLLMAKKITQLETQVKTLKKRLEP